jgi:hypothetical protein
MGASAVASCTNLGNYVPTYLSTSVCASIELILSSVKAFGSTVTVRAERAVEAEPGQASDRPGIVALSGGPVVRPASSPLLICSDREGLP